MVGSIDPAPAVTLASLFYPTAYPERRHPKVGLVSSQEKTLAKAAAATFMDNEQYDPNNKLMVVGHTGMCEDQRATIQALSARRAEAAKNYLITQGIPRTRLRLAPRARETSSPKRR